MATAAPNANLSFMPWVRQGAAAAITTIDTLGPAQRAVADLTAALAVNGAIGRGAILSPRGQLRGINAFTTQQRADLTRLGAPLGGGDDAALFGR